MAVAIGVVVGLVIGFVIGWLVRDEQSRPLISDGDDFGVGVPDEWYRRHSEKSGS